jgi:hypothetical protein
MMIGKEKITIQYGKERNRHRESNAMIINLTLLPIAMHEMNDTIKPCLTPWFGKNRVPTNLSP